MEKVAKFLREQVFDFSFLKKRANFLFLKIFKFLDHPHHSENRAVDFSHAGDFLFLPEIHSARKHIYPETISLAVAFLSIFFILLEVFSFFTGWSIIVSL